MARVDIGSHNSHKPPSSDSPYTEPKEKTKSRRKTSGKGPVVKKIIRGITFSRLTIPIARLLYQSMEHASAAEILKTL